MNKDAGAVRNVVELRDEDEDQIEGLFTKAQEAKLLMIWDQDADACRHLAQQGLEQVTHTVASLAAWEELERDHLDNAHRIADEHGIDLMALGKKVAARLEREGYPDRAARLVEELQLSSVPEYAGPATDEIRLDVALLELDEQEARRAAVMAIERFLHTGDAKQAAAVAHRFELVELLKDRVTSEIDRLMRPLGEQKRLFQESDIERAATLARGFELYPRFRACAQEVAIRALMGATVRGASTEVSAASIAWRYAQMEEDTLRTLIPIGLLLCVLPMNAASSQVRTSDNGVQSVLELARSRMDLTDPEVLQVAHKVLESYVQREESPRALAELARFARTYGENELAWKAADRACSLSLKIHEDLEPEEGASELEACLKLLEQFEVTDDRMLEIARSCVQRWLPLDPRRAVEIAQTHGLDSLTREAAEECVRAELETLAFESAEKVVQSFELERERVTQVVREVVRHKIEAGEILKGLQISKHYGVEHEEVRRAAQELVDTIDKDSHYDDLVRVLEVADAAGLKQAHRVIARRIFIQRYEFSRMFPSYAFLVETLRFGRRHELVTDVGNEYDEGLSRVLAFQANRGEFTVFNELATELGLNAARIDHVVGLYLDRIIIERAPWYAAVELVARSYRRQSWLREHADRITENAITHGALDEATAFAQRMRDERLQTIVQRARALIEHI